MAVLVTGSDLSEAWVNAMEELNASSNGKLTHLNVAWTGATAETPRVRAQVDQFMSTNPKVPFSMETVAHTIFPQDFYHPHLGVEEARARLLELHSDRMSLHRRRNPLDRDTYFNRLVNFPIGEGYDQLGYLIDRLTSKVGNSNQVSSAYEAGLTDPRDGELRVQAPGQDRNYMGFPCLSHLSLTLERSTLSLTATYRNQAYISRAYGNFLGLARLTQFIADQTGAQVGEIQCVATHADIEFGRYGKRSIRALIESCRAARSPVPHGS